MTKWSALHLFFPGSEISVMEYARPTSWVFWHYDDTRAREELGWQASYSLREGIKDTINCYRRSKGLEPL